VSNVEPSGNSSEVTIKQLTLIDAVCAGEAVDLGLLLRDSIQKLADKKEKRATLGHCSLLTRLLNVWGAITIPADAVVKPKGPVNRRWLEKTLKREAPLEGQGNMDDLEAEIDGFEGVDLNLNMDPPDMGQPNMDAFPGPQLTPEVAPNQHSVNEMAHLLTQLDISNALWLPNNYYDQSSALYRESMTYREQFFQRPFYPLYPTMEAMQRRWTAQETDLQAAQLRERDAWLSQQSEWEAMQQGLFRDSPHHGGSSHAGPSMPHPNDQGDDDQQ
jgi:hypothetical protein